MTPAGRWEQNIAGYVAGRLCMARKPIHPTEVAAILGPCTSRASRLLAFALPATVLALGACATTSALPGVDPADIPRLEAELARDRENVELLTRLGAAYRGAGQLHRARETLEGAVRRDPTGGPAIFLLALTWEDLEDWTAAAVAYGEYARVGRDPGLRAQASRRIPLMRRRALQAEVRASLAREAELAQRPPEPRTVAVFPFLYAGADPTLAPLGRALSEMLSTDLSQTDRLRVLERARVQLLLDEIALGQTGRVDSATVVRSGRILGAGRIVQGTVSGDPGVLRLESAVVPVGDPAAPVAPALSEQDRLEGFFDAQKRLVLGIYEALGVELTPAERERVDRRPTRNVQALLAWGEGLEAEDRGDFAAAAVAYQRALALDPEFDGARLRAGDAGGIADALSVDTGMLQGMAQVELPALRPRDLLPPAPTLAIDELERLLPSTTSRSPIPEVEGTDVVGGGRSVLLELILRRPG